ncbi:JmjC domain-containing protein [Falsiroseomonas sp.]|uniref:JmjC domain-containing protein n=1 Tax=Falsiroseomonas sp. TaxID=2870721 RepID=UPI003F6FF334
MQFDDFLAPLTGAQFLDSYLDIKPVHLTGNPYRLGQLLSAHSINEALATADIWAHEDLQLLFSGRRVPTEQYCYTVRTRAGDVIFRPDADRVRYWIAQGASVVLNGVETYTSGLRVIQQMFLAAGFAESWANIYISQKGSKALEAHCDTHDVWILQASGQKIWNIWQGREEWPREGEQDGRRTIIEKAAQSDDGDSRKGELLSQVILRPGDVLYLPHGWYHSAIAEAEASMHVTFGVRHPSGLDLLQVLFGRAVADSLFRRPLPLHDRWGTALAAKASHLAALGDRLAELARDPATAAELEKLTQFSMRRGLWQAPLTVAELSASSDQDAG